jgi:rhamnosyl/mannosyltransferase
MGIQILHIYKDYYPVLGGMENHIKMLAESQVQRGYQVTVLVTHPTSRTHVEEINGVRVIKAGRLATVASTPLSLSLPWWLVRQRPDIAHLHFPYPIGELSQWVLGRAPCVIMTYHSDVVRQKGLLQLYRPLLWQVLRRMNRIIATSPNYIESSPYLCQLRDKCVAIPLGVELERFLHASPAQAQHIRDRYGTPLLLFVGRLRYYKGLQFLLEAMPQIPAKLLVVGSGPMQAEWQALAAALGVTDRVFFVGKVSDEDLPAYYRASDLFVLPAGERSEAFGTVQIEAMASGLPVVCTELGTGTSYVNRHGETGLVVPARNSDALANAICSLLQDEARRQAMGQRAQQRALREFSLATMVDRIDRLYEDVLQTCHST